jgi:hypothetical protein
VIEGLRSAPFLYSALNGKESHNVSHLRDCTTCKATTSALERARIACGWLPLAEGAMPVQFPGLQGDDGKPALTVCPGYTTRLPQVREASEARLHWERGTLRQRVQAEPTQVLLDALQICEGARNELSDHRANSARKDG